MRELLMAAERGIRYLEGLNGRGVAPEPTVVAHLAELDIPLPAYPSPPDETLALLDTYNAATMAMANFTCLAAAHHAVLAEAGWDSAVLVRGMRDALIERPLGGLIRALRTERLSSLRRSVL